MRRWFSILVLQPGRSEYWDAPELLKPMMIKCIVQRYGVAFRVLDAGV
jgi:hypothetical protein